MQSSERTIRQGGFTLIEMLVVIGIIVVLVSLSYPVLTRVLRGSEVARMRMDLQALSLALDQYKQDHGDYPRDIDDTLATPGDQYRGAILLVQALVAPADAAVDGADGPGFRYRATGQGRVFGPYIKMESFRIANPSNTDIDPSLANPYEFAVLMDDGGKPILYFPGRATRPDITQAGMFVGDLAPGAGAKPLYNRYDNQKLPLAGMRKILGDRETVNGAIDGTESAATTGSFLLWSAGPDAEFGTEDDITNFNE